MTTINTIQALDERVVEAAVGHLEIMGIYLGRRLGLYTAIAGVSSVTAPQLAARAGIAERYAQEWLEQQAVAGFVNVRHLENGSAEYSIDEQQRAVFVTEDHPAHVSPLASMTMGVAGVIDQVVEAYRHGTGVPYAAYGRDFRHGQGGINRPAFTHELVASWLPAIPEAITALRSGEPVGVLDVGTGQGWAAMAVASAFPEARVTGIDNDPKSIEDAIVEARVRGVDVDFRAVDAAAVEGSFELALLLEVLHDLAHPVDVLSAVRRSLSDDGVALVADEAVADEFSGPGDILERMMYGWSITACLPASMAEEGSAAIGTVLRPGAVDRMAREAGFGRVEVLDIDGGFFRLYALRP